MGQSIPDTDYLGKDPFKNGLGNPESVDFHIASPESAPSGLANNITTGLCRYVWIQMRVLRLLGQNLY